MIDSLQLSKRWDTAWGTRGGCGILASPADRKLMLLYEYDHYRVHLGVGYIRISCRESLREDLGTKVEVLV